MLSRPSRSPRPGVGYRPGCLELLLGSISFLVPVVGGGGGNRNSTAHVPLRRQAFYVTGIRQHTLSQSPGLDPLVDDLDEPATILYGADVQHLF